MEAGPEPRRQGPVVALAGRRIDAPDAPRRFPLENAKAVAERIRAFLAVHNAAVLVGSAACGADLIAQEQARALGLDRHVVLPFQADRFRATSVTDRPGDWGTRYDAILRATGAGEIHILENAGESDDAYAAVNAALLDQAEALAIRTEPGALRPVLAIIVWEGHTRGDGDLTADFAAKARARGIPVTEILTT